MKDFTTYLLSLFFFIFFIDFFAAQELSLKLSSEDQKELAILSTIAFEGKHQKESAVYNEVEKISSYLKELGFFYNVVDSISKNDNLYIGHFNLGEKINEAIIQLPNNANFKTNQYTVKNNRLYIDINRISDFLSYISKTLDSEGKSFSKASLNNIIIKNKTLFAELNILPSKKRTINKVIIKPYTSFPKSYITQYFNLKKNNDFSQERLSQISEDSKQIKFIDEIKSPEVLFTKDSTLVYLYLKKRQQNSFDGLINFTTKENGDFLFNGNLDLKLNNILDRGERFELFYNSIAAQVQDFKVATEIPYIFSSAFSTKVAFNIYKQDSSFLNTRFKSSLLYAINPRANLSLNYETENSNNLTKESSAELQNFTTNFVGAGYSYRLGNPSTLDDKLTTELTLSLGRRTTDVITKQLKINFTATYLWQLNFRNSIYVRNETGYLNSDNYLTNELFRIGGANSIRGFNEQSIFTSKYTFLNTEYRYKTATKSYLFSILDYGNYTKNNATDDYLLGIGLGYSFATGNNNFKISSVLGKTQNTSFSANTSKIIINWVTSF